LAFLKTLELFQLLRAVDAPSQAEVHHAHVIYVDWLDGNSPWLAAIPYLQVGAVPLPV
jgi:hypothetical protein